MKISSCDQFSRRALLWLVPLFITVHNLEEWIGFPRMLSVFQEHTPDWVVQALPGGVFPPTGRQFAVMLLLVTLLAFGLALLPGVRRARGPRTQLLAVLQMLMLVNGLSHLAAAALTGGYVPGLATALVFNLPFSLLFFVQGLKDGWIRAQSLSYLLAGAFLLHGPGLLGLAVAAGVLTK